MGGSNYPRPPDLGAMFAGLQADQQRQAGSPGTSYSKIQGGALEITDKNGTPTISNGEYTFTTGPWTGKTISSIVEFDGLGNPQIILGPQPDGTDGLGVYNQLGVKLSFFSAAGITQYDDNGNRLISLTTLGLALYNVAGTLIANLTTAGLENFDTAGQPRSISGLLPSGDYGLGVFNRDNSGSVQEVLPVTTATQSSGTANTAGYTYVGPYMVATIGASGRALIRSSAYLGLGLPNMTAKGGVAIDGDGGSIYAESSLSSSGSDTVAATVSAASTVTGLTAGVHNFGYWAAATGTGATASVANIEIEVQPL